MVSNESSSQYRILHRTTWNRLVDLVILPDRQLASPLPFAMLCLLPPILSICSERWSLLASYSVIASAYFTEELNLAGKDVFVYLRLRHIRSNGYQIDPYIRNLRILDMS